MKTRQENAIDAIFKRGAKNTPADLAALEKKLREVRLRAHIAEAIDDTRGRYGRKASGKGAEYRRQEKELEELVTVTKFFVGDSRGIYPAGVEVR